MRHFGWLNAQRWSKKALRDVVAMRIRQYMFWCSFAREGVC